MSGTEPDNNAQESGGEKPIHMSIPCRSVAFQGKNLDIFVQNETMSLSIDGQILLEGPVLACFNHHIQFPSFSESVKRLTVNTPEHSITLNASKEQLNDLKHIRDGFSAISDPGFASRTRSKAWLYIIGGLALMAGGPALTMLSYLFPDAGGNFRIFFGLSIFGLAIMVNGFVLMGQASRASVYEQ